MCIYIYMSNYLSYTHLDPFSNFAEIYVKCQHLAVWMAGSMFWGIEPVEAHRGFVVPSGEGMENVWNMLLIGPGKRTKPIIHILICLFFWGTDTHLITFIFLYLHIHFSDHHVFIGNLYEFVLNSIAVCPVCSSLRGNYLMILNGVGDICEKSFQLSNQKKSRSNLRVLFSMTKVNHPNHPCWTIFSLKMLLYAKLLWMWLYVWQPQNKTQTLPVISAAGKHVRLQQCWWWWFVITDLRAGRLWSLATSMECSIVIDPKDP